METEGYWPPSIHLNTGPVEGKCRTNKVNDHYSDHVWLVPFRLRVFMVPGILVMMVTRNGLSFAANNIVRGKEMGPI